MPGFELVGFFDPDTKAADVVKQEYGLVAFESEQLLIEACDAVDIVTNTINHFTCAAEAMRAGKHVFIEKPVCTDTHEGAILHKLAEESQVKVQVGHIERFNPALLSIGHVALNPMFIEAHRLSVFSKRGTDVSVVMDLMIHDLDIILKLVKSNIKRISASGVAVVSDTADIANARLEFDNGCVANITASRLSFNNVRKIRMFQKDAYITVDFLEKKSEVIRLTDGDDLSAEKIHVHGHNGASRYLSIERPKIQDNNALQHELELFRDCILNDTLPTVSLHDALMSLQVAERIQEKILKHIVA